MSNKFPAVAASEPRRGRLGSRKDRTGCVTCKKRRVKCDEGKPFCSRCTSTGRKCDGYLNLYERRPSPSSGVGTYTELTGVSNDKEYWAFHYFTHGGGAVSIAARTNLELWACIIPQRCHSEPSIRHAVIAVGFLLLRRTQTTSANGTHGLLLPNPLGNLDGHTPLNFAIQHYNKAVQSTLVAIKQGTGDAELACITCILFFCIEALQGHEQEALRLFEGGHRAVMQLVSGKGGSRRNASSSDTTNHLAELFSRLAIQCSMFTPSPATIRSLRVDWDIWSQPPLMAPFESLGQAKMELIQLTTCTQSIVIFCFPMKWEFKIPNSEGQPSEPSPGWDLLRARRMTVDAGLEKWYQRFITFQRSLPQLSQLSQDTIASSVLLLQYLFIRVWLAASTETSEMIYDNYMPQFSALVAEAHSTLDMIEILNASDDCSKVGANFTLELGLIPPLYMTVIKCRDPSLRRQALSLLRRAPAQEGLWNRDVMLRIGERVVELEECTEGPFIQEYALSYLNNGSITMLPPAETRRIHIVKAELRTTTDGEQGIKVGRFVEFYTLPHGMDGAWCVSREFFEA